MMASKKILVTDNISYKINIFDKKDSSFSEERETIITNKEDFFERISVRKELEEKNKKEKLAKNLMNGYVDVSDLTDEITSSNSSAACFGYLLPVDEELATFALANSSFSSHIARVSSNEYLLRCFFSSSWKSRTFV